MVARVVWMGRLADDTDGASSDIAVTSSSRLRGPSEELFSDGAG
jgi:hypothetical protein